jgi:dipeptidyl aminopeptidase/acylaminoacyl peptidase
MFNDTVRPFWTADGSAFSYRRLTRCGVEYRLVVSETGVSEPLFDPAALAASVKQATGTPAPAIVDLREVRVSADGEGIEFVLAGRFWRAERATYALADLGAASARGENVAPDGTARLILADHDLWLIENSGERVALTDDGEDGFGYGDFGGFGAALMMSHLPPIALWSPDSRRIATFRADTRQATPAHLVEAIPPDGSRPKLHSFPYPLPGDSDGATLELWLFDRSGNRVRAKIDGLETFAFNALLVYPAWWSADSRFFHFIEAARDGHRADLWRIDASTGDAERLVVEQCPGAGRPRFGAMPDPHVLRDGRILWASEADGWSHLYFVEAGNPSSRRRVTAGDWRVVSLLHVDEDEETILLAAAGREPGIDPYYLQVYSVGFDGSNLRRLTPEDLNHDLTPPPSALLRLVGGNRPQPGGTSSDGRFFVAAHEAVDSPPVSVLYDGKGAAIATLERADASEGWPNDMPLPEPFHVRALDGVTDLWGVLYKPYGFDPSRTYPVVEVIYGGPQMAMVPKSFRQEGLGATAEALAAAGFVTLIIDGPGTPARSRDFWFRSYGQMESCGGLDDHVAAIKALAADRPWMDIARGVGLTGMSSGGYSTVRGMAAHPDFFTVGVATCGNHDLTAYVAQWAELFQGLDTDQYRNLPNADVAGQIMGKLFLIQGEMDDNVHPTHMLRLVDALVKADADFDMLIIPGADHGVASHPYAVRRTLDFFLRHLSPAGEEA